MNPSNDVISSGPKILRQNLNTESSVLTKRETEVLTLIASEFTNEEIANRLKLSKRTVDSHRQNIINKLGVKNTAGLIKYAFKVGII